MDRDSLYRYVVQYLELRQCTILERTPTYLTVRLSVEADKEIMGRPYYWLYIERTGIEPEPLTITFVFDPEEPPFTDGRRAELLHLGSPRLHDIFRACQQNGRFIRLYEQPSLAASSRALTPWLCINYKISFISDQKKDLFYPLGFNLINGEIIAPFDQPLSQYQLTPKIPDYHFTLTPIFSLKSALQRIEQHLSHYLDQLDQTWAIEAQARLEEEADLIRLFFNQKDEDQSILDRRLIELEEYQPRIEVDPINIGLYYLETHPLVKTNHSLTSD